jgi:outer membrane protein assembly factor BamA
MRVACVMFVLAALASGRAHAEEIREINVDENTKTDDDTVALIAGLEVGDDWNVDMIDKVKKKLEASGLFKEATVFSEPHKSGTGVKITIIVKDKHSWIIAPAFYTQPTNIGGGIGFGENNLFGKNQKLLLYGQIATQDTFFIGAWVIPKLGGTRWYAQLDTFLKSQRNIEYAPPREYLQTQPKLGANKQVREARLNYLNAGLKLGIELYRGIKVDARVRGAKVSYANTKLAEGASIEDVTGNPDDDPNNVPKPGAEGTDVSTEFTLSIDRRATYGGVQTGYRYGVSYEQSAVALGSDFRYFLVGLGVFRGEQILKRHNLVFKGAINYGFHLPFQQEFLMGGTSMRGWLNNQFRGDFRAFANLEYSVPVMTIKGFSIRALAFWDSGFTTFLRTDNPQRNYLPFSQRDQANNSSKFNEYLAPFKNTVGIGTRFNVRQIVLPLLGLDFGYGLEARDFQVYLAIGLTD